MDQKTSMWAHNFALVRTRDACYVRVSSSYLGLRRSELDEFYSTPRVDKTWIGRTFVSIFSRS